MNHTRAGAGGDFERCDNAVGYRFHRHNLHRIAQGPHVFGIEGGGDGGEQGRFGGAGVRGGLDDRADTAGNRRVDTDVADAGVGVAGVPVIGADRPRAGVPFKVIYVLL